MSIIGNPILTGVFTHKQITKVIDKNGLYVAANDGAPGYSRIQVNVRAGGGTETQIQNCDFAKFKGVSGGIQLPYNLDETTGIEVEFMFETNSQADTNAIGTWDTGASGNITWIRLLNEGGYLYIGNGTISGQTPAPLTYGERHVVKTNVNGYTYMDDAQACVYIPTNPNRDVPLVIGDNYMTTSRGYFTGRIYSYKLFNRSTGSQICELRPVKILIRFSPTNTFEFDAMQDIINGTYYVDDDVFYCDNEQLGA